MVIWTLDEDIIVQNTIVKAWCLVRNKGEIKQGFIFHSGRSVKYASSKITALFSFNNNNKTIHE